MAIATARVVGNVGVGACLGALTSLTDPMLVTIAGSILAVEARHQSILNLLSSATSLPHPFDVALTPGDVLSIAGPFISGSNPPLTVTNSIPLQAGTKLNFSSPVLNQTTSANLSCKIVTGGLNTSIYQPMNGCMVPANVTGPMHVFITDDQTVNSMNGTTNLNLVVAGPALLFIDQPDCIGKQIRPGLDATGTTTGNHTMASTIPSTTSPVTETTSALSVPAQTSAASIAYTPSLGVFTTTISLAQASALLSSLLS